MQERRERIDHKIWKTARVCLPKLAHHIGLTLKRVADQYALGKTMSQEEWWFRENLKEDSPSNLPKCALKRPIACGGQAPEEDPLVLERAIAYLLIEAEVDEEWGGGKIFPHIEDEAPGTFSSDIAFARMVLENKDVTVRQSNQSRRSLDTEVPPLADVLVEVCWRCGVSNYTGAFHAVIDEFLRTN